ncbi:hypothetical protein [uncultured Brevundimonas sp.]|uniref:hypothetical protein n=1 Tax=uncultured Brevundimonas sp. TaxID=213418 RepID=UPI00260A8D99|nr:hypothetical protein [uncultured Brevundimonas sp.]
MDLCITPGVDKLFRLALVGPGDRFEALSEHDTPEAAIAAKLRAQAAADDALAQLNKLMRTPA